MCSSSKVSVCGVVCSFYVWEILHSTVIKMKRQVQQLQKSIDDMRDQLKDFERKVTNHILTCCDVVILLFSLLVLFLLLFFFVH